MPVFKAGEGKAPKWSELEIFEIIDISTEKEHTISFRGPKERYICIKGEVNALIYQAEETVKQYAILDIPNGVDVTFTSIRTASCNVGG